MIRDNDQLHSNGAGCQLSGACYNRLVTADAVARMTYAEYCAFEREARVKHEYLRGEGLAASILLTSVCMSKRPSLTRTPI